MKTSKFFFHRYFLITSFFLLQTLPGHIYADEFKIGYILPLTGEAAYFGDEVKRGIILAEEDLKKEGKSFKIVFGDEKCQPKHAVNAWYKITQIDKASVVIGPSCSGSIMAAAPVAKSKKRPLIALWDAGKEVAASSEQTFGIGFNSEMEGELIASHLIKKGLLKTAIFCEGDKFAELVRDSFRKAYEAGGGTITENIDVKPGEHELASVLIKLKNSNPDALFVSSAYSSVGVIKGIRKLQIKIPVFGQDTFSLPFVIDSARKEMEGVIFANAELDADSKLGKNFKKKYKKRFKEDPATLTFAAFGYDSLMIAAKLPKEVSKQAEALNNITWNGVLPFRSFKKGRMLRIPPALFTVKDGKVELL